MKKKWGYLLSGLIGLLVGAILMTSGSALAAQVKSLVGLKVTGEYTVIVNNKELSDKGAVIDGKTNAPVRAISDAIGGKLDVDNKKKVINITTETIEDQDLNAGNETTSNKYIGDSKASLEKQQKSLKNDILAPTIAGRDKILSEIETLKKLWDDPDLTDKNKQLKQYEDDIAKYTEELKLVEEALEKLD